MRPWLVGIASFAALLFLANLVFDLKTTCRDGWASPSIGSQGACSSHGGVTRKGGLLTIIILIASVGAALKTEHVFERREAARWKESNRQRSVPADSKLASTKLTPVDECEVLELNPHTATPITPAAPGQKACPKCGAAMRKKKAKRGYNRGNMFWSCSRYPLCTGLSKLERRKPYAKN